jgi:hypothetical protein
MERLWQSVRAAPDQTKASQPLYALLETLAADVFERLYPGARQAIM